MDRLGQMSDDAHPSHDVLLELGRVAWAAINLEDTVYFACRAMDPPADPQRGDPAISARIAEVREKLLGPSADAARQRAAAWLEAAEQALQVRNSVMHSTPATFEPWPGTDPIAGVAKDWLMHFPRSAKRRPVRTPLTVESLKKIRVQLESASQGWVAVVGDVLGWPLGE